MREMSLCSSVLVRDTGIELGGEVNVGEWGVTSSVMNRERSVNRNEGIATREFIKWGASPLWHRQRNPFPLLRVPPIAEIPPLAVPNVLYGPGF